MRPTSQEIWAEVKANHARLDACPGPHIFEDATPEKAIGKKYICKLCTGQVDTIARSWYERGREHEARRIAETQRLLTCAFCGEAYPPGTPASNHEALTAHVKVCPKHPVRAVLDNLRRIVAAWREDEIGQIDGELIEEAEALLGIEAPRDPLAVEDKEPTR